MKKAEKVKPANEPQGIVQALPQAAALLLLCRPLIVLGTCSLNRLLHAQIFQRNWHKLFSIKEVTRNAARATMILAWVFYHTFITFDLLRPFHMVKCASTSQRMLLHVWKPSCHTQCHGT